jgi:DegV family protein with EDD domain
MSKFAIVCDGTCDLNAKFREEYDIRVIPGHMTLADGEERTAYMTWDEISRDDFYAALKKAPDAFTTAPPNSTEFAAVIEEYVKENVPVLVMTISGGISGAFGFASSAANEIKEKYPDAKIEVVDSMRFGPGFGLMAIYASAKRAEGLSIDEVKAWLEDNKNRFHQAGWLDDLSFVAKKGRLTHAKAFFGTLAGVKPIGEFDYNGLTTVIGKAKGAKAAYEALIEYIAETGEDLGDQIIFIAQTNRMPQAQAYKKLIEERFSPKAVYINDVFPSCGINIGPGLMAAYYVGKPISKDLSEEKAIIEKKLNSPSAS